MAIGALSMRIDPRTAPAAVEIADAAKRFEALLIEQMLEPLTESDLGPAWLSGGAGGKLARELQVAEIARVAAERGVLGLPELLARGVSARSEEDTAKEPPR